MKQYRIDAVLAIRQAGFDALWPDEGDSIPGELHPEYNWKLESACYKALKNAIHAMRLAAKQHGQLTKDGTINRNLLEEDDLLADCYWAALNEIEDYTDNRPHDFYFCRAVPLRPLIRAWITRHDQLADELKSWEPETQRKMAELNL